MEISFFFCFFRKIVDRRWMGAVFFFLLALFVVVCLHLFTFSKKEYWEGRLEFMPVVYSIAGLMAQGLIAILYGAPYSAIIFSGCGSLGAFGFALAQVGGIYDWLEKCMMFVSIFYVGIRYLLRCSSSFQMKDIRYILASGGVSCVCIFVITMVYICNTKDTYFSWLFLSWLSMCIASVCFGCIFTVNDEEPTFAHV